MCTSFSFCFVFFKGGRGNEKKKMDKIDSESLNLLPASDFFFRITIKEKKRQRLCIGSDGRGKIISVQT